MIRLILLIILGTILMTLVMLYCKKQYNISPIKCILASCLLTIAGVLSVMFMFFIENGKWGGLSFFGAVFFVPVFLYFFSDLLRIKYLDYLDIAAPSVCTMLAVMKINCMIAGCCGGKILYYDENNNPITFPSRLCEMITALIIGVVLIILIKKDKLKGKCYPLFMILYGITRFVLNIFRDTEDFIFGLGIGNMWAIISLIIGLCWLVIALLLPLKKQKNN